MFDCDNLAIVLDSLDDDVHVTLSLFVLTERDSKERRSKEKDKSKRKDKDVVSSLDGCFLRVSTTSSLRMIN